MTSAGEIVAHIEQLIDAGAHVDEMSNEVHRLLTIAPKSLGSSYEPRISLYRATKHHRSIPTRIDDLWYPPVEKTTFGRANRPGSPMFYCSSDPACVFLEIGASIGNLTVSAKWVTTRPMLLHDLGYTEQVMQRAGSRRSLPEHHASFHQSVLDDAARAVRDFIALAFTEPSPRNYHLTTALAEVFLRADEFAGILYPAVSKAANVDNLALRPSFVRDGLRLETAQVVIVDEITADFRVGGRVLADLQNVDAAGNLTWSFRDVGDTIPSGGAQAVHVGQTLRAQTPGLIEVLGTRYRVEVGYTIEVRDDALVVRDVKGTVVPPIS